MIKKKLTAIDLFCGAGGLTLGLRRAGFRVLAGVENNIEAAKTYRLNHRRVKLYQNDIRELDPYKLMLELNLTPGDLDLLAGCPPCQGFSTHRTRNKSSSFDDDRNELLFEFFRFVQILEPKAIMLENVPALGKDWRIQELQGRLKKLGYFIDDDFSQVKDVADYGVPQRRKRLLVKASKFGSIPGATIVKRRKTVFSAIGSMAKPGESGDNLHDLKTSRSEKVQTIISLVPKDGGSRKDVPREYWLDCHKRCPTGYNDVYGRMAWNDVAPTITGGCGNPSKGRFIHPDQDRAITLREAALLQTFPKNYQFSLSAGKDAIALMIGNALPPEFIKRQALAFRKHLEMNGHE